MTLLSYHKSKVWGRGQKSFFIDRRSSSPVREAEKYTVIPREGDESPFPREMITQRRSGGSKVQFSPQGRGCGKSHSEVE